MDRSDVEERVIRAVNMLFARDADLLRREASEWSVTHRLAVYIEDEFPGWNVDCEFNRQGPGADKKRRDTGDGVRPDIIVHHRGHSEPTHNLLVIEVKALASEVDCAKVREYTAAPNGFRVFQYQFGLSLVMGGTPSLTWFSEGEQC